MTGGENSMGPVAEITLFDLFLILNRRRRWIFLAVAAGILLGLLAGLLTPSVYTARTTIVPSGALATSPEIGGLGDFRAAASQFGLNLGGGGSNPSLMFPEFLGARDVLDRVLSRTYEGRAGRVEDLAATLELRQEDPVKTRELAARFFSRAMSSAYDLRSGITTVQLTLSDPVLAAGVLNAYIEEMDAFAQGLRSGRAGQKAEFISQRLEEIQGQLALSETRLTEFRLRNRQTGGAPQLQLEEGRLLREVRLNEEIFLTLKSQLEIARIEEFSSLPGVIVLAKAHPPQRKSAPHRAKLLAFATLGSAFAGVTGAFAWAWLETLRARLRERGTG